MATFKLKTHLKKFRDCLHCEDIVRVGPLCDDKKSEQKNRCQRAADSGRLSSAPSSHHISVFVCTTRTVNNETQCEILELSPEGVTAIYLTD